MNRSVTNSTPFAAIAHINSLFAQTGAEIARLNQTLARVLPTESTPVTVPLLRAIAPIQRRAFQGRNQHAQSRMPNVRGRIVRRAKGSRRPNPARGRRLSIEEKNQALAWLQHGVAVSYIATQLKVTRPTIYNLRDKYLPDLNRNRGGYRHGKRNLTKGSRVSEPQAPALVQIPIPQVAPAPANEPAVSVS